MTHTASLLTAHDLCHRAGWRSLRQPPGPQGVFPVLRHAVDIGLTAPYRRPEHAAMAVRDAALSGRLEVNSAEGIYRISEHLAAIAEQIVYVVGGKEPWRRPSSIALDAELTWTSSVWLDAEGSGLRRVVLTGWRDAERLSWFEQGEQAIYGMALTTIVVVLGAQREGRVHGYWSKGWKHPQTREVRIADPHGGSLRSWLPVWRENERIQVKEWTEKMQPVMASALRIQEKPPLKEAERTRWRELAFRKLRAMRYNEEPEMQISQCGHCAYGPCSL